MEKRKKETNEVESKRRGTRRRKRRRQKREKEVKRYGHVATCLGRVGKREKLKIRR